MNYLMADEKETAITKNFFFSFDEALNCEWAPATQFYLLDM